MKGTIFSDIPDNAFKMHYLLLIWPTKSNPINTKHLHVTEY